MDIGYDLLVYKYNLKGITFPLLIYQLHTTFEDIKANETSDIVLGGNSYQDKTFLATAYDWKWEQRESQKITGTLQGTFSDKNITLNFSGDEHNFTITGNFADGTNFEGLGIYHATDDYPYEFPFQFIMYCMRDSKGVYACNKIMSELNPVLRFKDYSKVIFPVYSIKGYNPYLYEHDDYYHLTFGNGENVLQDINLKRGKGIQKMIESLPDPDDPNGGGGNSSPSGGGGPSDIGGDTNSDDGLPTISALDSGLLTAYNPTVGELQSLGKFLWSDSFDVNSFKKLFNDPFDTLLGLSIVPIKPTTSSSKNIMFGNMDSGVSAPVVSNQWVTKDLGSVTLNEVWKGALDYSPSTSASIYLPFIGMRQLNINDVMGSTLHLIYKFDVLTGGCVAQIYVNHNHIGNKDNGFSWTTNQGLLYEFMGQCSVNIPLASQDFTNTIRSAVSAVGMVAGTSASIATGNPVLGVATATMASANLGMQANTPTVERSGHLSGSCSILGYYQPFLVVTRPHQCKPSRYYALRGVPSQVYTSKLSNCTGYTQITANNNIHISGAEDSELAEIQNLLVSGVYFPDKKR